MSRWAIEELIRLKKYGRWMTIGKLIEHFKRPRSSILKKLNELNITPYPSNYNKWTEEEEKAVLQALKQFSTWKIEKIRETFFPNRSIESFKSKIKQLKRQT